MRIVWRAFLRSLRWLGIVFYWLRLHRLLINLGRRRVRVLLYHACEPEESDFIRGLSSNTTPEAFRAQIRFINQHYYVLPLQAIVAGQHPTPAATITFDDGYGSVFRNAWPILRTEGIPATVYLVADAVDTKALVWVNELNWFLNRFPAVAVPLAQQRLRMPEETSPSSLVERARAQFDTEIITTLLAELRERTGANPLLEACRDRLYLSWSEVHAMTLEGASFGNHTATHPNLARLTADAKRSEIDAGKTALERELGECPSFAFPFGDRDADSRRVAMEAGHSSLLEVGGGNERIEPWRIGRHSPHAMDDATLFADLEIVAPMVAFARRTRERFARLRASCPTQSPS